MHGATVGHKAGGGGVELAGGCIECTWGKYRAREGRTVQLLDAKSVHGAVLGCIECAWVSPRAHGVCMGQL